MPSNDIFQLFLNSSGAAVVTGLFVYYLIKKDKRDEDKQKDWNKILNGYLKESIKVKEILAEKLQRNTDVLENLENIIDKDFRKRTSASERKIQGKIKANISAT